MKKLIIAALSATLISACSSDDDSASGDNGTLLRGIQSGETIGNVSDTMAALETALVANPALNIVAQIDHQANASNNGLELRPTRVTLFGNPSLGTPLMQINQLAGLDLPQKMFAWEDEAGQSHIAYNSTEYLSGRHGLDGAETLTTISGALNNLATAAGMQDFVPGDVTAPALGEGITVVESANDMNTTVNNLRQAINGNEQLTLVTEVDHSANASIAGLDLEPTTLFVFGNPNLGTPLMLSGQSIGIDLPQKMLVFEDSAGVVSVAYNDPAYLATRHGITDQADILTTVANALANLSSVATTAP